MNMPIEIDETSEIKPFNFYKFKVACLIIFIIMGILMIILLIIFLSINSKNDKESFSLDNQKYQEINIDNYNESGYYIPKDNNNIYHAPKKCSITNCKKCYGNSEINFCTSCIPPYVPLYNNDSVIKACELLECEIGYYLPTDNYKECKKCSIDYCSFCNGTTNNDICFSCLSEYFENINNGKIISCDIKCEEGSDEKCLSCDNNTNICSLCNQGYYIPSDSTDKKVCEKCSLTNCETCSGEKNKDICVSFISVYFENKNNGKITSCDIACETGRKEKCASCDTDNNICSSCNQGYYLPTDAKIKTVCKKCTFEHCKTCSGTLNKEICDSCLSGYFSKYVDDIIISCERFCTTGTNEKCLTCDTTQNICGTCNKGYYLPIDATDKKVCSKCSLANCQTCNGTLNNDTCIECSYGYFGNYEDGKIISCDENSCEIGENEKCQSCDVSGSDICLTCNEGYYLPTDASDKSICKKCSINFCKVCSGTSNSDICSSCLDGYNSNYLDGVISFCGCEKGDGDKCLTCDTSLAQCASCNAGYDLIDGKCVINYSFRATYVTTINNQEIEIMNEGYTQYVTELTIDNVARKISYKMKIARMGEHVLIFKTNFNSQYMTDMFRNIKNMTSIVFTPRFDTKNIVHMDNLFLGCSSLTSVDISNFKFDNLYGMYSFFYGCTSLTSIDFSNHEAPNLVEMHLIFYGCTSLVTVDLSNFNSPKLTYINSLFNGCMKLKNINFKNFITSNVNQFDLLFYGCSSLTSLDLSGFNTQNAEHMEFMFYGCTGLTSLDISNFNTEKAAYMNDMFKGCSSLTNLVLSSSFNTQNVIYFNGMFDGCKSLTSIDLKSFNIQRANRIDYMFANCISLLSLDLSGFKTYDLRDMDCMFMNCSSLKAIDISSFITTNILYMNNVFKDCTSVTSINLSGFNTQNVKQMSGLFYKCSSLQKLDLISFVTSNTVYMNNMFKGCLSLTSIDLSKFITTNVITMENMFSDCSSLNSLSLSHFDVSNVLNMNSMFYNCASLKELSLSNFITSKLVHMVNLFSGCSSLTSIDISNFDTSKVIDMDNLFYNCSSLKIINFEFNTNNVRYMNRMFDGCAQLSSLDITNFDTNKVVSMQYMFNGCSNLKYLNIRNFDINIKNVFNIFKNIDSSVQIIVNDNFKSYLIDKGEGLGLNLVVE